MSYETVLIIALLAATIGLWIGIYLTNDKWARNADRIQRIEHGGRLYKVLHDDDGTVDPKDDRELL